MDWKLKGLFIIGLLVLGYELATIIFPLPWSKEIDIEVTACVYETRLPEEGLTNKLGEVPVTINGKWSNKLPPNRHASGLFEGIIKVGDESLEVDTLIAELMSYFLFMEVGTGEYSAIFPGLNPFIEDDTTVMAGEFTKYFKTFEFYHYEEDVIITTCANE